MLGDHQGGHALAMSGLLEARALGLRPVEALYLSLLNMIASIRDDLAADWNRAALALDQELGNMRFEARDHCNIGIQALYLGDHGRAATYLAEGLRLTRAVGDRHAEAHPLISLSLLSRRRGDNDLALVQAQGAVDIAVELKSPDLEVVAFMALGHAELGLGHAGAASVAYERAQRVALALSIPLRHDAAAGLATAALAQDDLANALAAVESVVRHIDSGGSLEGSEAPRLILFTCYAVLARTGSPRAREFLDAAHANLVARKEKVIKAGLPVESFLSDIPEHREILRAWGQESRPAE
jgi:hypothetical protein